MWERRWHRYCCLRAWDQPLSCLDLYPEDTRVAKALALLLLHACLKSTFEAVCAHLYPAKQPLSSIPSG